MYLPVVRPDSAEPLSTRLIKTVLREFLHMPVKARMRLRPEYPWLNSGAVRMLREHLTPGSNVFEWGGGRSTLFFARRVDRVTTLEHKAKWNLKLTRWLAREGIDNVDLRFIEPNTPYAEPDSRPPAWDEQDLCFRKPEFAAYADSVLEFPEESFDMILVDGRARVACAANARERVKPGGLLVLDNSEWPKYAPIFAMLRGWEYTRFANGVWETTVFRRPLSSTSQMG
ncbi:methyltransferase domain containing protein [Desulfohalovibrio reitneri]|uniref:methyltransferase domain containing protein n=1 Tax=Desulfohalovibrio reitneri TaxID=1307759 RepID=UPI000557B03E|nr:methyltransferase domain containing protein [Desulfohalovibrio reitneri]